ncbi:MAG: hypothetical protein Q8N10_20235 [Phenylobacterium sp.]|nr:hypothetical protein [Phenylobacterium sp.]
MGSVNLDIQHGSASPAAQREFADLGLEGQDVTSARAADEELLGAAAGAAPGQPERS